ncbi:hypothetical protein BGW38_003348, partial [Lunasporangiospora selenospora]
MSGASLKVFRVKEELSLWQSYIYKLSILMIQLKTLHRKVLMMRLGLRVTMTLQVHNGLTQSISK